MADPEGPDLHARLLAFMREADEWGTPADVLRSAEEAGLHIVTSEERQRMVQNELDAIKTMAERKVLEACAALKISTDAIGPISMDGKPQICSSTASLAAAEYARRHG